MERKLYLKILRYLRKFGVNHETDIYKVFKRSHVRPRDTADIAFQLRPEYINDFLQRMKEDGYLEYAKAKPPGSVYETSWSTPFEIRASITHKGYAYSTQQSSIRSAKNTAVIAIIISAVAIGLTTYELILCR